MKEGNLPVQRELEGQIQESKDHTELFRATLDLAAKRFRIEEKHANQYRRTLSQIQG